MFDFVEVTFVDYDLDKRKPVNITEIRHKSDIKLVEKIKDEYHIYLNFPDGVRRYEITPEMYNHLKNVLCDKVPEAALSD